MAYEFQNLVFEGGGVRGIAYLGALEVLEERGVLPGIRRAGGTSAGAIYAMLVALGYRSAEMETILRNFDLGKLLDDDRGFCRDLFRLVRHFGWCRGATLHRWLQDLIAARLGNGATFRTLQEAGRPGLYICGTNLNTRCGEIYSPEHTPDMRVADAVRISAAVPFVFTPGRNAGNDICVDGGLLANYPVTLFDREGYIHPGRGRPWQSAPAFNRQTLGLRLDTAEEIGTYRDGAPPPRDEIRNLYDFTRGLTATVMAAQNSRHRTGADRRRTVYIDTLGAGTLDFTMDKAMQRRLIASGREAAEEFLARYDAAGGTSGGLPTDGAMM